MNERYKPKIVNFYVNWNLIKEACMTTVGKEAGKEPTSEWKRKLLLAEHSPIRRSMISWKWQDIPYCNSTHFARHHEGIEKYIKTSRSDRTGIPRDKRSQTEMVLMEADANIQALINIAEKRLCMQADKETRAYMQGLLEAIKEYDEDIAYVLVPQCVRIGACPELFGNCHYFENFAKNLTKEELIDIRKRYDAYNEFREEKTRK